MKTPPSTNAISTPVAIHGLGVIGPSVRSLDSLVSASNGDDSARETMQVPPPAGMSARDMRRLARLTRLALCAADRAAAQADLGDTQAGIYVALTHGTADYLKEFHDYLFDYGPEMASPNAFSNGVTNAPLGSISLHRKLTQGGVTLVGMETGGMEAFHHAASKLFDRTHDMCLVGATEEYSSIVESVYHRIGWYRGERPQVLPCVWDDGSRTGFGVSEGSVFCVISRPDERLGDSPACVFTPIEKWGDVPVKPDVIVCGAGGGPQDRYELEVLARILSNVEAPTPVLFPKSFLGETFAVGPLFSLAVAWDILVNAARYPSYPVHQSLASRVADTYAPNRVKSVMVVSSNREGLTLGGLLERRV